MGQRTVAIDVSPTAVRLIALEASFRRAQVTMVTTVPIPEGTDRVGMWQLVRDFIPTNVDNVVVAADGRASSTRALQFPFVDPKKVDAAVEFELESVVPYELANTAVTWHVANAADGRTDVLAALAAKESVRALIAEMGVVSLEPRSVVLPSSALAELLPPADECRAVVAIGATTTHLAIVRRSVLFARTLRVGLKDGSLEQLPALVREINTTLRALPPRDVPTSMLLTGGGSRIVGLTDMLAAKLTMSVGLLDVAAGLAPIDTAGHPLGPEYAIAVGLAASVVRRGRAVPLNFRRGDLAYHGDLQVYRGEFTRIAVGIGAVLICAIIGSIVQYSMISAQERQITKGFCDASKKIIGREICDPNAVIAIMRQSPGAADGVVVPLYSASSLFGFMSSALEGVDVQFSELEFRVDGRADQNDRITGKGDGASFETVEEVANKLRQDRCVKDVDISRQKKIDQGRVEFAIAVQLMCPLGVLPGAGGSQPSPSPSPAQAQAEAE